MSRRERSVAERINGEMVVVLGWGRAILLQLAHPLIAAGVGAHSHFGAGARGFVQRAHGTIGAMLGVTFGSPEEAQAVADRVNRIHDRVNGRLAVGVGIFPAGTRYSAHDPRLLCWVHATLIESMILSYEAFVGPLTAADKDAYAADAAWMLSALGVPADQLLTTTAQIDEFLKDGYAGGEIAVGEEARRLADLLLAPPMRGVGPAFACTRLITVGLLPADIRAQYGFDWNDARARRFSRAIAVVRGGRRVLPGFAREWPHARRSKSRTYVEHIVKA
jgi:uncharacterized protein (DUF2236 family)